VAAAHKLEEVLSAFAMVALMGVIMRHGERQAEQIAGVGNAFARSIRIAQGLEPLPSVEERLKRATDEFVSSEEFDVSTFEQRIALELGLKREPKRRPPKAYYARGVVGAIHGRRRGPRLGARGDGVWPMRDG